MLNNCFLAVLGFTPWVSVLIILVYVLHRLPLLLSARFFRTAWLVLAVRCAVPLAFTFSFFTPVVQLAVPQAQTVLAPATTVADTQGTAAPGVTQPTAQSGLPAQDTALPHDNNTAVPQPAPPVQDIAPSVPLFTAAQLLGVLPWVWLAGTVLFLLVRFTGYAAFMRRVRRTRRPVTDTQLLCAARIAWGGAVPLYTVPLLASPALAGFWRHAVYLPQVEIAPAELIYILQHERCHAQRGDIWMKLLLNIANAVCWFNPLVWGMCRTAEHDIECACDELVLQGKNLAYHTAYGTTILKTLQKGKIAAFTTGFGGNGKALKARFVAMFSTDKKRVAKPAIALLLCCVLAASALFACTAAPAQSTPSGSIALSGANGEPDPNKLADAVTDMSSVQYPQRLWIDAVNTADNTLRYYSYDNAKEAVLRTDVGEGELSAALPGEAIIAPQEAQQGRVSGMAMPATQEAWLVQYYASDAADTLGEEATSADTQAQHGNARGPFTVYYTADNGASWQSLHPLLPISVLQQGVSDLTLVNFEMLNEKTGYLSYQTSDHNVVLLRTEDGAQSFDKVTSLQQVVVRHLRFINENVGFCTYRDASADSYTKKPFVLRTTDGGKTWQTCSLTQSVSELGYEGYRPCCLFIEGSEVTLLSFTQNTVTPRENVVLNTADFGEIWTAHERFGTQSSEITLPDLSGTEQSAAQSEYEDKKAEYEQAQKEWEAWASSSAGTSITTHAQKEDFSWPVPGYTNLSTEFGTELVIYDTENIFQGIGIPAPQSTPVYAAASGVVSTKNHWSYGLSIKTDVDDELAVIYGHLSAYAKDITDGVTVQKGQLIGYVGSTGNSTGNHLFFEVLQGGVPLDPMQYFDVK